MRTGEGEGSFGFAGGLGDRCTLRQQVLPLFAACSLEHGFVWGVLCAVNAKHGFVSMQTHTHRQHDFCVLLIAGGPVGVSSFEGCAAKTGLFFISMVI